MLACPNNGSNMVYKNNILKLRTHPNIIALTKLVSKVHKLRNKYTDLSTDINNGNSSKFSELLSILDKIEHLENKINKLI